MRHFDLTPFYRSTVGFDRLFSLLDQSASESSPGYPPYNIERTGENTFRISVAVSGFSPNEISIVAKENTLTIKGEKKEEKEEKGKERYYMERSFGSFQRMISIPAEVDTNKVDATFKKGVLSITLPKLAKAKEAQKKIQIKAD